MLFGLKVTRIYFLAFSQCSRNFLKNILFDMQLDRRSEIDISGVINIPVSIVSSSNNEDILYKTYLRMFE
ncbi:hypothetical protein [Candidatus Ichthyocystis sparus]|uniref:hypothetical protein n=1 Tax=Candidatus Ichthyocystis sparus TaxID=1561004 RepID=UPI000B84CFDA|nr:hypothetical protein [Candidatus Ichthyocystis sparus]